MRSIARAFKYLVYFAQADTPELRKEASDAAKLYYNQRPHLRTIDNVSSFKRGFRNVRCSEAAKDKLGLS
jgi:hypothetical protein